MVFHHFSKLPRRIKNAISVLYVPWQRKCRTNWLYDNKNASNAFSRWLSFIDQYLCDFNETYECGNVKLICANGHSIKLNSCSNHVANESILKERKRNKSFGCAANLDLRKRTHTNIQTKYIEIDFFSLKIDAFAKSHKNKIIYRFAKKSTRNCDSYARVQKWCR